MEIYNKGGILPFSDETFEILLQNHPKPSKALDEVLLKKASQEVHPVIYRSINSKLIKDATKRKEVQQVIQERTQTDADVYFFQVN